MQYFMMLHHEMKAVTYQISYENETELGLGFIWSLIKLKFTSLRRYYCNKISKKSLTISNQASEL